MAGFLRLPGLRMELTFLLPDSGKFPRHNLPFVAGPSETGRAMKISRYRATRSLVSLLCPAAACYLRRGVQRGAFSTPMATSSDDKMVSWRICAGSLTNCEYLQMGAESDSDIAMGERMPASSTWLPAVLVRTITVCRRLPLRRQAHDQAVAELQKPHAQWETARVGT